MSNRPPCPTDMCIIVTYRCPMRCQMCNIWQFPSDKAKEITAAEMALLPDVKFINITGGEPFIREDLEEIVHVAFLKAPRVVISTSGWYDERVIQLAKRFPKIGIRVSIEGLSQKNDELRGRQGGFDKGLQLLLRLKEMGIKDIGFGITVSDSNSKDMLALYRLAKELKMEFATAALHNSYYFHKSDNVFYNKENICVDFRELIKYQLKEQNPKSWFRAYFNWGLIRYIKERPRLLPCEAGQTNFFIDPFGEVYPCNGLEEKYWKESMGNIRKVSSFKELWESEQAEQVRMQVRKCPKNCWMIGTAAPVMKKYVSVPAKWVVKQKIDMMLKRPIKLEEE